MNKLLVFALVLALVSAVSLKDRVSRQGGMGPSQGQNAGGQQGKSATSQQGGQGKTAGGQEQTTGGQGKGAIGEGKNAEGKSANGEGKSANGEGKNAGAENQQGPPTGENLPPPPPMDFDEIDWDEVDWEQLAEDFDGDLEELDFDDEKDMQALGAALAKQLGHPPPPPPFDLDEIDWDEVNWEQLAEDFDGDLDELDYDDEEDLEALGAALAKQLGHPPPAPVEA